MKSKWAIFENDDSDYKIQDLGRPAVFLLPSHKLRIKISGKTVENELNDFLMENFGAFTTTKLPYFGLWRNDDKEVIYDECVQYEVSFAGKEHIPLLLSKLASIAATINEECIYFKAGQYACLVKPK